MNVCDLHQGAASRLGCGIRSKQTQLAEDSGITGWSLAANRIQKQHDLSGKAGSRECFSLQDAAGPRGISAASKFQILKTRGGFSGAAWSDIGPENPRLIFNLSTLDIDRLWLAAFC